MSFTEGHTVELEYLKMLFWNNVELEYADICKYFGEKEVYLPNYEILTHNDLQIVRAFIADTTETYFPYYLEARWTLARGYAAVVFVHVKNAPFDHVWNYLEECID